jgi:hypothetical protein
MYNFDASPDATASIKGNLDKNDLYTNDNLAEGFLFFKIKQKLLP